MPLPSSQERRNATEPYREDASDNASTNPLRRRHQHHDTKMHFTLTYTPIYGGSASLCTARTARTTSSSSPDEPGPAF